MTIDLTSLITAAIPVYMAKKLTEVILHYTFASTPAQFILVIDGMRTYSEANETHIHWTKKAERTKFQRESVNELLTKTGIDPASISSAMPITITLTRFGARELDQDNLAGSSKHLQDGIADWLGVNDNDKRVLWAYDQRKGGDIKYGVEITFETREAYAAKLIREAQDYLASGTTNSDSVRSPAAKEHNLGARLLGLQPMFGAGSYIRLV